MHWLFSRSQGPASQSHQHVVNRCSASETPKLLDVCLRASVASRGHALPTGNRPLRAGGCVPQGRCRSVLPAGPDPRSVCGGSVACSTLSPLPVGRPAAALPRHPAAEKRACSSLSGSYLPGAQQPAAATNVAAWSSSSPQQQPSQATPAAHSMRTATQPWRLVEAVHEQHSSSRAAPSRAPHPKFIRWKRSMEALSCCGSRPCCTCWRSTSLWQRTYWVILRGQRGCVCLCVCV